MSVDHIPRALEPPTIDRDIPVNKPADREEAGLPVSTYIGFHMLVLGLLGWATGLGFLLPSIGPTVFALATLPDHEMNFPGRAILGRVIGAVAGVLAVELLLGGFQTAGSTPPLSLIGLKQVLASLTAVSVATVGMYVTDSQHPPAYATALIVSLGVLGGPWALVPFVIAVGVVIAVHELIGKRVDIWNLPYEYDPAD